MSHVEVLHSVKAPNDRTNPFVELHVTNLPPQIRSHWFSWKRALLGEYDVLHFQWPENLLRASSSRRRLLKRVAFGLTLGRTWLRRTPIVITVHNLTPHESPSKLERWMLRLLHQRASALIALNDTEELTGFGTARVVVIPHGDYRQRYSTREPSRAVDGRVVFFGSIRAYKNIPGLIAATTEVDGTTLVVAGKPWTPDLAAEIERAAADHASVRLELYELRDDDLIEEISAAEIVVLPYSTLYNSGAIFLALTVGVPVLAPSTPSTRQIQSEVGADWLLLYEGDLSGSHVRTALHHARQVRETHSPGPDLSRRDWGDIGREYAKVYGTLATDRRTAGNRR